MILLFSGGLDSYIAWHYLEKPNTLYVNLGHRYAFNEMSTIMNLIPMTKIDNRLSVGDLETQDGYIPLRNALLLEIASFYDSRIALVAQKGEQNLPDRSPLFFDTMSKLLTFLHGKETICFSPFADMTKTQMVKWYLSNKLSKSGLLKTTSCYHPKTTRKVEACGLCSACFRRWVAFTNNGIKEKYHTAIDKDNPMVKIYVNKIKNGEITGDRLIETVDALTTIGVKVTT